METFWQQLLVNLSSTTWLEYIAVVAALAQVILATNNKKENFLFGAVSVAIYVYLYLIEHVYADASLNLYYFVVSIYGFYLWNQTDAKKMISVTHSNKYDWLIAVAIAMTSFAISYLTLIKFTDSIVPMQDSAIAAFAWAGTWLLTKRKLETWIWLNISNAIAVPLLYKKGYALTSILTVVLFIIAIFGFIKWRKELVR
jgi:nicotinamide mononucleotide transporter